MPILLYVNKTQPNATTIKKVNGFYIVDLQG
ncbi:hypothetical protein FHS10_002921 [Mucilaginibacter dorajii]|nr:hypothetical protein [Mucilaginibacter dorajii]